MPSRNKAVRAIAVSLTLAAITSLRGAGERRIDLTLHEGTSMAAALSPDGRTIAIDLLGRIWTLPASGGTARPITDDLFDARQPACMPFSADLSPSRLLLNTREIVEATPLL